MRIKENNEKNTIDYEKLNAGDCFRFENEICVKSDFEQDAIRLVDGQMLSDMCGEMVTPVNAEVQIID